MKVFTGKENLIYDMAIFIASFIDNLSVSLSLYCLVLFYMAAEDKLEPFKPFPKFLTIKVILFFSFWQSCALNFLTSTGILDFGREQIIQIEDFLICFEMLFVAYGQSMAFSYEDFINDDLDHKPILKTLGSVLNVQDVLEDAHKTFIQKEDIRSTPMEEIESRGSDSMSSQRLDGADEEESAHLIQNRA
eukprot:CAMPEP_0115031468 /NCGR_PEP_ID=MMETSP0216-20121206/38558_1 /TAXON_ID=223996 /ORGANISM="Protocruzia adherens, Strain Boccale" /LENGTH=189 /DNA_ID=CAMNT_0002409137 /DNA_START=417 /DNA_END=985 /DNA_ORIENTATION=-